MSAILGGAPDKQPVLIMGRAYPELAEKVIECLETEILETTFYDFTNGEVYVHFTEPVHGADVFVLQCHSGDINKWVMEQLIMIDALKRASAKSVTMVAPFLDCSRQDKKHHGREPTTARLIFDLFHAAGTDRITTIGLYAAQEQGFSDGPIDHLAAMSVLLDYVRSTLDLGNTTIVSPSAGHIKVSEQQAARLDNLPLTFIHKQRGIVRPNHAEAHGIIGDVDSRNCVVIDDMVGTTDTICEAVRTLNESSAKSVTLITTHGLFSNPAVEHLSHCNVHKVMFMDTVPIPEEKRLPNMTILSYAPPLTAGIYSVFEEGSVTILLDGLPEDMRPRNIYV